MPLTSSNLFWRLKLMKLVSIRTRYGGTRAVLCCRKREEETCGLTVSFGEWWLSGHEVTETYALFTSFSFSASSFCFCLSWFSFLPGEFLWVRWSDESSKMDVQPNVVRVEHPLHSGKFACLFDFDLRIHEYSTL